jgi:hypothetical protein
MTLDEQAKEMAQCLRNYLQDCARNGKDGRDTRDMEIVVLPFLRRAARSHPAARTKHEKDQP